MSSVVFCMPGRSPYPVNNTPRAETRWPRVTFTPEKSPRNGFEFSSMPSSKGVAYYSIMDYAAILDCAYEMARDQAEGNGEPYPAAIEDVLRAEGWRILPTHRAAILARLEG